MSLTVLGGGIGGLSALYYLSLRQNLSRQIKLYEASSRYGGWVNSKNHEETGVVFETGPRTLRPAGNQGMTSLELIENLGLQDKVVPVPRSHPAAKNRMIFAKNQVCLMPSGPGGIFKKIPPFSKPLVFAGLKDIFTGKSKVPIEDESLYSFVERRFGKEIAEYAISPVICGICAGDAKEISVKFLMKEIFEKEQKYGGIVRGVIQGRNDKKDIPIERTDFMNRAFDESWSMYRMQGGIETIPRAIVDQLQNNSDIEMNLNSPCDQIEFNGNEAKVTVNGKSENSSHIISTLPAFTLANLVKTQHPSLADELQSIPYVDVAVINLLYAKENLLKNPGFGVLVAPCENLPILGIIFDSCITDSNGNTILTVMSGGRFFEKYYGKDSSKEFILKAALENISKILKIDDKPDFHEVYVHRQCIPQYNVGHNARVERIKKYISEKKLPLSVGGSAFDGVGINDVILSSKNLVNALKI